MNNFLTEPFIAKELIYDKSGFTLANPLPQKESAEYSAYTFELDGLKVLFRLAKITPAKKGQFVTLWKRIEKGPIMPFDASDAIDIVVIATRKDELYGHFVFPKQVLMKYDIFTTACKDGKRAIRVYPPWDKAENAQAKRTQKWQLEYFLEIKENGQFDSARAKQLYQTLKSHF
jgi:hypothetical protein